MNLNYSPDTKRVSKILIAALIIAAVCSLAPASSTRASLTADEWDEVFDTARAVLGRMPDVDRIQTLKHAGLREAVLRAYRALKAIASVNKDQSRAVKRATLAEFERAFDAVRTEVERSEYQTCASKCKTDGSKCEKDCASARKKLCSCKITEFGCLVTKCLFS